MTTRLLPLLCLLTACAVPLNAPPSGDDDGNGLADDDDTIGNDDDAIGDDDDATGDDDDAAADPEQDCGDGADDDGDGAIDCVDEDCAAVFHCTWPDVVELQTVVEFFAGELALEFGVGDCVAEFAGELSRDAGDGGCGECDLEYAGQVSYDLGDCPADFVDQPPSMALGLEFLDASARTIWDQDDVTGAWELLGDASSGSDGSFQIISEEPVMYDVPLLGKTEVGQYRLTRTIRDL